ncbi:MAG: response regulator [Rhodoferax sp.]|nr:MAG: response regulator [Rhodoferax sp.]
MHARRATVDHILIVDDHADIRKLLGITLGKRFEIIEAQDGETALMLIERFRPRLVLLDIMMPGAVDGLKVLDTIKSNPHTRDTIVAMVTARGQQADSEEAKRRGADAYFVKPFSPLKVVAWVQEVLQ